MKRLVGNMHRPRIVGVRPLQERLKLSFDCGAAGRRDVPPYAHVQPLLASQDGTGLTYADEPLQLSDGDGLQPYDVERRLHLGRRRVTANSFDAIALANERFEVVR